MGTLIRIMNRIILTIFCAFFAIPLFSQVDYEMLDSLTEYWNRSRVETVLQSKISDLFDYQKERIIPMVNHALEKDSLVVVFHATVIRKEIDGRIEPEIELEQNDFPLDLYFLNDKKKFELRVTSYNGEIGVVDNSFASFMRGVAVKQKKSFNYIVRQKPDMILECKDVFGCYYYIKSGTVYVVDYLEHGGKGIPIDKVSNFRLPEKIDFEALLADNFTSSYLKNVASNYQKMHKLADSKSSVKISKSDSLMFIPCLVLREEVGQWWDYQNPSYNAKFADLGYFDITNLFPEEFMVYGTDSWEKFYINTGNHKKPYYTKADIRKEVVEKANQLKPRGIFTINNIPGWFFIIGDKVVFLELIEQELNLHEDARSYLKSQFSKQDFQPVFHGDEI